MNGVPGVTIYSSGTTTKILSMDEASKTWGYYGVATTATDNKDGMKNTEIIVSESDAAKWCRDKGPAWYLPALYELKEIYEI